MQKNASPERPKNQEFLLGDLVPDSSMKILVLGGLGMLGHQVCRQFARTHETWCTVRSDRDIELVAEHLPGVSALASVDAMNFGSVEAALEQIRPAVVINCIGIIKQDGLAKNPIPSITVNALFPHLLARKCSEIAARLIHISTDCVFSGSGFMYKESDPPDCTDLYGRSKFLGEVHTENALTIRTSIIGPEIRSTRSLLDWFLSQHGQVRGYTGAIFSGLTTYELSRVISRCATDWTELSGLYQVSADPISKFDLLNMVKNKLNKDIQIDPCDTPMIDRSLDSSRFRGATGYRPPSWDEMVSELAIHYIQAPIGGIHVSA